MKFSIGQKVDHNYHSGIWEILRLRMDEAGVSYDLVKKAEDRSVIDHVHGVPEHQLTAHVEHQPHRFKVGDRVRHKVAGTGTIVRLDGQLPNFGGAPTNKYIVRLDKRPPLDNESCWFEENIEQIPKWEAGDWLAYNLGGTNYVRKVVDARITGDGKEEIKFDTAAYFIPVPVDAFKITKKPTFLSGTPVWTKDGKASGQVRSTLWINGVEEVHCAGGDFARADTLTSEDPGKLTAGDWVGYSYGKTASGLFQFVRKVVRVCGDGLQVELEGGGHIGELPTGWAKMKMYPTFGNGQRVWDRYGEEEGVLHTYWHDGVEWVKVSPGRACKASDLSAKAPEAHVKVGTAVKLKSSGFYAAVVERVGLAGGYTLCFSDGSLLHNVARDRFEPCPPITLRYRGGGTVKNDSGRPIFAGEECTVVVEPTFGTYTYRVTDIWPSGCSGSRETR